jgi:nucleotide-binding universal stress UspA family protein
MFAKILVALDSSEYRQQVFTKALDIAKADQASLMLVHVLSFDDLNCPQVPVAVGEVYLEALEIRAFEDFYKEWHTYEQTQLKLLQSQQEIAIAAGLKSEITVKQGRPGPTICDLARTFEADLIIVGRRGHTGLKELVQGSVSSYVMHHAPCSVLIVQ